MEEQSGIIWLNEVDSTNDEVRRRLSGLDNLSVVAAVRQTAGRGQGDHTWTSEPGRNLTFSLVLKFPPCGPVAAGELLLITQVVTRALREYLLGKGLQARIKWPNDIYIEDRKICGILIENILDGKMIRSSIIGIGLNLNQLRFPPDLPNPVSVSQLTGQSYDPAAELRLLREELKKSAALLDSQDGRIDLDRYFDRYVFRRGE